MERQKNFSHVHIFFTCSKTGVHFLDWPWKNLYSLLASMWTIIFVTVFSLKENKTLSDHTHLIEVVGWITKHIWWINKHYRFFFFCLVSPASFLRKKFVLSKHIVCILGGGLGFFFLLLLKADKLLLTNTLENRSLLDVRNKRRVLLSKVSLQDEK